MAFTTSIALDRLVYDLMNTVTGASRKSLWRHNRAQMQHLEKQCSEIKDRLLKSPPIEQRKLPSLDPITRRMESLDRLLQGGELACWSQMIETQCELERTETSLFQLFDYNGTASAKGRRSAMIQDLQKCVKSIDAELKRICDNHGWPKPGCNAVLWKLLAPKYIQSGPVSVEQSREIVPYNAMYDDDLWLVLQDVSHTFLPPENMQPRHPPPNPLATLFKLRHSLLARLDRFRRLAAQQTAISSLSASLDRFRRLAAEQTNQADNLPQHLIVLRKLGFRGFVMVFVRRVPDITMPIGHLTHRYLFYNGKAAKEHVKCYDMPAQVHNGGGECIYTPLLGGIAIGQRTCLVLVDEGAEFFIAAVVGQKDGIALPFDDRIVQNVIKETYPPPLEVLEITQRRNRINSPCSDFAQLASTIRYRHYLDVYYSRLPHPPI